MKMKNKLGNAYVIIGIIVIFVLILGGVFLVLSLKKFDLDSDSKESQNFQVKEKIIKSCEANADCKDQDSCVISTCSENMCVNTPVVLCYNSDGCCPENCNPSNDNDCLGY